MTAATTTGSPARPLGGLPPNGRLTALLADPRLPRIGTVIEREHAGRKYRVEVTADGLRCDDALYVSPSALARDVTGTPWNGWLWLGLLPKPVSPTTTPPTAPPQPDPAAPAKRRPGRPIAPRRRA